MKQQDITIILVAGIVAIVAGVAFFVFKKPSEK